MSLIRAEITLGNDVNLAMKTAYN